MGCKKRFHFDSQLIFTYKLQFFRSIPTCVQLKQKKNCLFPSLNYQTSKLNCFATSI